MKAPGKGLLQVGGILLIIMAVWYFFLTASMLMSYQALGTGNVMDQALQQSAQLTGVAVTKNDFLIPAIFYAVKGLSMIVAGIIGIKNCNRQEKANICLIFAIVMLAIIIVKAVYDVIAGGFGIIGMVLTIVVPVLYLWGALKNKQTPENV